jgi:hypothetical protein
LSGDADQALACDIMNNYGNNSWFTVVASLQEPFPKLPFPCWDYMLDYGVLIKKEDGFVVHPVFKEVILLRLISSDVPASWGPVFPLRVLSSFLTWRASVISSEESLELPSCLKLVVIPPELVHEFQAQGFGIHPDMIVPKGCAL